MTLDLEPFGEFVRPSHYSKLWVPVVEIGRPAFAWPALVKNADKDALLGGGDLAVRLGDGGPEVLTDGSGRVTRRRMYPTTLRGGTSYRAFAIEIKGGPSTSWYEPLQPFLLYWDDWREGDGLSLTWRRVYGDADPEKIARWRIEGEDDAKVQVLQIRRDRLIPFLSAFGCDLVVRSVVDVFDIPASPGQHFADRQGHFAVQAKAYSSMQGRVQARATVTAIIEGPPYDEKEQPWAMEESASLPYTIRDESTGKQRDALLPHDKFLTDVFFRPSVLDRYHDDSEKYEVRDGLVLSHFSGWALPIARTKSGNLHAYLGDLDRLPRAAQQHWQSHALMDESGIPEDRRKRDFEGEWAPAPLDDMGALRAAIEKVNKTTQRVCGQQMYAAPSAMQVDVIKALRVPTNGSLQAFQEHLVPLALLVVEHIDAKFLDAAQAPADKGSLGRLAQLVARLTGNSLPLDRQILGGLYTIQNLRSSLSAHRAGSNAQKALKDAKIVLGKHVEGFVRLVREATSVLLYLTALFDEQPSTSSEAKDGHS